MGTAQTNSINTNDSSGRVQILAEVFVLLAVSALAAVTFLKDRRFTEFEIICLTALILYKTVSKKKHGKTIPRWVIIVVALYLLSEILGALMSSDTYWALRELRRFDHVFIAGLLFTAPISDKNRKILTTVFFIAAAIAGVAGVLQYFGILSTEGVYGGLDQGGIRSRGFSSNAILYASILAVGCSASIVLLFFKKRDLPISLGARGFLFAVFLLTLSGIFASGARGVWVALFIACIVTILLYDKRKSLFLTVFLSMICIVVFAMSPYLMDRAVSIVASVNSRNVMDSTGVRIELWKGSLLIFKDHPLLGVGTWDYQSAIDTYIQQGKLKTIPVRMHAHNIYFHALATRGIIGFLLTIALLIALILWGRKEIRENGGVGGYVIILIAILASVGGLTEINLDINQILAAKCLAIGLMGPYGIKERKETVC